MLLPGISRQDFVVSIRPHYAKKIVEGEKTVELRRRFVDEVDPGSLILIYSTSPIQAIIGRATIDDVRKLSLRKIWQAFADKACVDRREFDQYFYGLDEGYAILLKNVKKFRHCLAAADLRKRFGFVPPQSFRYLPEEYYSLLDHERLQAPH